MCTSITIKNKQDGVIIGRTEEFGMIYNNDIVILPKGFMMSKQIPFSNKNQEKSKYVIIAENVGGLFGEEMGMDDFLLDGFNSEGLAMSGLFFPQDNAVDVVEQLSDEDISIVNVGAMVLAQCKSIEEVITLIENINKKKLFKTQAKLGNINLGSGMICHFTITDRLGRNIILEPTIKGELKIIEGIGIMTNSPSYDFHLKSLGEYANVLAQPAAKNIMGTKSWGLAGGEALPSGTSPNARFIRAKYYQSIIQVPKEGIESIILMERIMNNFDILPGFAYINLPKEHMPINAVESGEGHLTAHTDHTIIKDLDNLTIYWKDWNNQTLRYINLNDYLNIEEVKKINMLSDNALKAVEIKL